MYRLPLYFDAMETWILIQPHSCTVRLQSRDFGLSRIQNNANLQIMVRTTEQTNVPTSVFQKAYRNTVACYIWPVSQPTKYPKHTGLSGFRSVLTALSKNCVAHFFARRFPAVILVKKSVREHIGLRCRFCQASCTFVITKLRFVLPKVTCRLLPHRGDCIAVSPCEMFPGNP